MIGIDEINSDFERTHRVYFQGEFYSTGPWYYYVFGLFVKSPLGFWLIVLVACGASLLTRRYSTRDEVFLLLPMAVLIFVTAVTTIQYVRYALPVVPFAVNFASKAGRSFSDRNWPVAGLTAAGLQWMVVGSLSVYPHSGSYFNALAGAARAGHAHFIESSIDWGQDLLYLRDWYDKHPQARPFHLAYFGRVDPRHAGLEFTLPPKGEYRKRGRVPARGAGPQPGWHAVSVSLLRGFAWLLHDGKGGREYVWNTEYRYFLKLKPAATAGYSISIYHVTLKDANRLRREMGLAELTADDGD